MNRDDCFELGYVIKTKGLGGEVNIHLDADNPLLYGNLESVFVEIEQKLVPFFIEKIQVQGTVATVKFQGVDTQDQARSITGSSLLIPESQLPLEIKDKLFLHDLIGYTVNDVNHGEIGRVVGYYDGAAQNYLGVEHQQKEVLVPVHEDIILKVDLLSKRLRVHLPDGLLGLYLDT